MDTSFWGPAAWRFIHAISFDYPNTPTESDQANYRQFFESLQHVLPCPECRNHFRQGLQKHPLAPHMKSRDTLSQYWVDFHNRVNLHLGKPMVEYEMVKEIYSQQKTQCTNDRGCVAQNTLSAQRHLKFQTGLLCCILILLTIIIVANVSSKH